MTRWLAAPLAFLLASLPNVAAACSVCMTGREDDTKAAFIWSTAFLSVLPLAVIGGIAWWLRGRARALAQEAASLRPDAPVVPAPHSARAGL